MVNEPKNVDVFTKETRDHIDVRIYLDPKIFYSQTTKSFLPAVTGSDSDNEGHLTCSFHAKLKEAPLNRTERSRVFTSSVWRRVSVCLDLPRIHRRLSSLEDQVMQTEHLMASAAGIFSPRHVCQMDHPPDKRKQSAANPAFCSLTFSVICSQKLPGLCWANPIFYLLGLPSVINQHTKETAFCSQTA